MSYFLSISFKKNNFFINYHSTLLNELFRLYLKFMNIIYYILFEFAIKTCC